jgi:hypothetical protein
MKKISFKEEQTLQRSLELGLLLFLTGALVFRYARGFFESAGAGIRPVDFVLVLSLLGAATILVYLLRIKIKVNQKGISYRYIPVQRHAQKIAWSDIEDCRVVERSPSAIWSGWNVGFRSGARSVGLPTKTGLHLKLKNGDHVLLGTHKPEQMKRVIERMRNRDVI